MNTIKLPIKFVEIDQEQALQRIDNFLIRQFKGVPKSMIYKILRKGEVRVNKKRIKPEYKLSEGDIVRLPPVTIDKKASIPVPHNKIKSIESNILYEDERLIVLNKPSGIAVHGGSGINFGVIEALRALRPKATFLELVHRLDRETSGCLLIAKKRSALRDIHEQLRNKKVVKKYHALVCGKWSEKKHKVSAPLEKNILKSGERLVSVSLSGKASETRFKLLEQFSHSSLIEASPITGRTHQIRVHCLHAGHPIALDTKYGDDSFDRRIKSLGCKRLCLHAHSISFIHPKTKEKVRYTAPYDDALRNLFDNHASKI